jgi:SAM-dependent methyltransferase
MLDYAKRRQDPDERLVWQQADALALPFPDKGFDAIVCQFGVMFFPDRIKGYREARRVLKDGGSYHFNVWDRIETNEFAHVVTEAVASHFPDDPPLFLARAPHGYHDTDLIHQELEIAGFSHITITTMEIDSIGATARHPAIAYCQGTPLRLEIESRNASVEEITEKVAVAVAARFGKGPVTGKIRGHVVEAK